MIKYIYKSLFTFVLVLIAICSYGQTSLRDSTSKKEDKVSVLKFGVNYLNNNVFMGRSDTTRTPVIMPNIKYTFKSGIYVSGSLDYLPDSKTKKLASGDLSGGYDFDLTDNMDGGISFTKFFYNAKSTQIASSQSGVITASLNYDLGDIVTPSVSADYAFNKKGVKSDVFIAAGLTHAFTATSLFNSKDLLIVSPAVTLNTGTQNFYDAYLVNKKFKNVVKTAAQNQAIAAQKQELEKFKVLDYELSVPVEYKINHFIFTFNPTYSIAQNKLPGNITSGLSNKMGLFNVEAGIAMKF